MRERLYISSIASDCVRVAEEYGLGLEIADFCVASNMDDDSEPYAKIGRERLAFGDKKVMHFPFAELCPCAIDPLARELARRRYRQAMELGLGYGVKKFIVHAGYIPLVYYPEWFVEQSILFWRDFLKSAPRNVLFCLENVMEPGPRMLREIAEEICDTRLRLCLDIGHASHRVSDTSLERWISELAPHIGHVHLHNNDRDVDRHWELGRGLVDVERAVSSLLKACPEASFGIECLEAGSSIKWLLQKGFI